jgi:large subunit ribosomal protein L21
MYAVIATGGKQYKVTKNEVLQIEKLDDDVQAKGEFDKVLLISDGEKLEVGAPYITGAKVAYEIVNQGRADKIHIIKFRRRKHYMRHQGHRQYFTAVKIIDIKN